MEIRRRNYPREYAAWANAKDRCRNQRCSAWPQYGGRGITFAAAWDTFTAFFHDMGPCPTGHSLERKDNDRGYEPGNCMWATAAAQNRNRSNTNLISFGGDTLCLTDWAARLGMPIMTLKNRLRRGWSPEAALTTPVRPKAANGRTSKK